MRKKKYLTFAILFAAVLAALTPSILYAQKFSRGFTVEDGLPSNLIYSFALDDRGFLWISTDNGVARFDGRHFKVFNTEDGLPDNEVLEVVKEGDGTIWANTFKQGPFYFDQKSSQFIDPLENEKIDPAYKKQIYYQRPLQDSGIVFYSNNFELVFKNRKLTQSKEPSAFRFKTGDHQAYLQAKYHRSREGWVNYACYKSGNKTDSIALFSIVDRSNLRSVQTLKGNKLYVLNKEGALYIVGYNASTSGFNVQTIPINDELSWIRFTENRINVSATSGRLYVFDIHTLEPLYTISSDFFGNCILEEGDNIWVGALNKGMVLYKKNNKRLLPVNTVHEDDNYRSIATATDGTLFAGSFMGEVVEIGAGKEKTHQLIQNRTQLWVRKIIPAGKKVFVFSEQGVFVDNRKKVLLSNNEALGRIKDAAILNDSIIIAAGVNTNRGGGLYKINTITERATRLPSNLSRISEVNVLDNRYIYCGTNEGLVKYDYLRQIIIDDFKNTFFDNKRITEIEITKEGLVCVATSNGGLHILHNNKIIALVDRAKLVGPYINKILAIPNKSLLVGTRKGVSRIAYEWNSSFNYNVHNFSVADGLSGSIINDIAYKDDTAYLATEKGIIYMPSDLIAEKKTIYTYLTDIKVNGRKRALNDENIYNLNFRERAVALQFSGVDLGGHLKKIQYTSDTSSDWTDIDGETLSLELGAGLRKVFVRSVSVNNDTNPIETLTFDVNTPLYLKNWFIILSAILGTALIAFLITRIKASKQRRKLEQQQKIEQDRNRITADLHDDIGSTLSSVLIYSNIAHSLLEKDSDKEKTKTLLKQISSGTSKIAENIGDIIWSMNENESYSIGMGLRIKNIISETLGPTDINYEITVDSDLDKLMTGITRRKNIILVIKEAVNNIVKYSNATMVTIRFQKKQDTAVLLIKDSGRGMNLSATIGTGNGLLNMKKRIEEIKGTFEIISTPGKGTEIICTIPF